MKCVISAERVCDFVECSDLAAPHELYVETGKVGLMLMDMYMSELGLGLGRLEGWVRVRSDLEPTGKKQNMRSQNESP